LTLQTFSNIIFVSCIFSITKIKEDDMKKAGPLLVALCMLLNLSSFADNAEEKKLYLDSGDIKITTDGIFLDLNGAYLPVDRVAKDEQGVFVTAYIDQDCIVVCSACGLKVDLDEQESKCPHRPKKRDS
jgi:hypothetical protein